MTDKNSLATSIERIKEIIFDLRQKDTGFIAFSIGTTASGDHQKDTYMTPLRKIDGGYIFGIVIFSQTEAIIISHQLDGLVDAIFVDAEKKLPLTFNPNYDLLDAYGLGQYKSTNNVEYGNISAACAKVIKTSEYFQYKANDLSVDAVWHYMVHNFQELSSRRFVIYGTGNIGNKLALKLVECGANVFMLSKYPEQANTVINAINLIKNKHALSNVVLSHIPLHASVDADAIIGCTNNEPTITVEMVKVMKADGIVIDLGKGTLSNDAIEECLSRGINTWRVDITAMLGGMVMNNKNTKNLVHNQYGRKEVAPNLYFVSGGYIGQKYDVIVDNVMTPTEVFGVCEAPGKVMYNLDETAQQKLALANKMMG